ncbi:MAG: hypothetical protein ACRDY4_13270 [Acidimicrobiia bacterium]
MTSAPSLPASQAPPTRSAAEQRVRRLLRLPDDGPRVSILEAQSAFGRSIAISATRCLITYVALPVLGPLVDLSGAVGPVLGLLLGLVSMVAIVVAARRLFAADHRWRWGYLVIGSGIFVLLIVQGVVDVVALLS